LGTIILPLNIVTGLWGMNCMVPGQEVDDLSWFWMIVISMFIFSVTCYFYVKKFMNMV
jgi:magnesium transporter